MAIPPDLCVSDTADEAPGLRTELQPQPFMVFILRKDFTKSLSYPCWTWTYGLPAAASQSAGIMGMPHHTQLPPDFISEA